jgi:hypothetical protein
VIRRRGRLALDRDQLRLRLARRHQIAKRRLAAHQKPQSLLILGALRHRLAQLLDQLDVIRARALGHAGLTGAKALLCRRLIQPGRPRRL